MVSAKCLRLQLSSRQREFAPSDDAVRQVAGSLLSGHNNVTLRFRDLYMSVDIEGLAAIANTDNSGRRADIVFVHGLSGGSHSTWLHGAYGGTGYFFWPEELGRDLKDCGIWSFGYAAGITSLGKPGMIIKKRAGNLSFRLANAGLGDRPLIFVTHSMGGLIVKSLVVDSELNPDADRKQQVNMIRGLVFCGTPHRGSTSANAAGVLLKFLGGAQEHVNEMCANDEHLDFLHDEFVEWHTRQPVPIDCYAESIGLFRTRLFCRAIPLGLVVPRASANPGIAGLSIRDVDCDHLTLVKPKSRDHDVYAGVLRFINRALQPPVGPSGNSTSQLPTLASTSRRFPKTNPQSPENIGTSQFDQSGPVITVTNSPGATVLHVETTIVNVNMSNDPVAGTQHRTIESIARKAVVGTGTSSSSELLIGRLIEEIKLYRRQFEAAKVDELVGQLKNLWTEHGYGWSISLRREAILIFAENERSRQQLLMLQKGTPNLTQLREWLEALEELSNEQL